jgi:hypothetical protein
MEGFTVYQNILQERYCQLSLFSDIKWADVANEYLASHEQRPTDLEAFVFNFPDFLQRKAEDGDCPSYLFELAYYQLAQAQVVSSPSTFPTSSGIHLNPSATFLNFEFDVVKMLEDAENGSIHVLERPHILCLFLHPSEGLFQLELNEKQLEFLSLLEEGPKNQVDLNFEVCREFLQHGLLLDIT